MSGLGFPSRFTRGSLGPDLKDSHPVEDPTQDVGEESLNAIFWQTAGLNLTAWRAILIATWTGGSAFTTVKAEAWNAKGEQSHPVFTRTSAGVYTYQFAAQYKDEKNTDTNIGLTVARAFFTGSVAAATDVKKVHAWRDPTDATLVHIRAWDASNNPADCSFICEIF